MQGRDRCDHDCLNARVLTQGCARASASASPAYQLNRILPTKTDPLVSLMMVEKVPDSTYEMVGGLDKQIKEIKEVIELRASTVPLQSRQVA